MKISILGCGWLGLALGKYLVEKGHEVKGSVRSTEKFPQLAAAGIQPFQLELAPEPEPGGENLTKFLDSDVLVINIPPSRSHQDMESYHASQMQYLAVEMLKTSLRKTIFISSTSVYPSVNREVSESEVLNQGHTGNYAILLAENYLRQVVPLDVTVLRCGGLMGYNRIPGKYFAGKKGLNTAQIPVNYIHRDDVISIIEQVIVQKKWNRVFNIAAPKHPTRKEVYEKNAQAFGFEMPTFSDEPTPPYKIVSCEKLVMELKYSFQFPDPLNFTFSK